MAFKFTRKINARQICALTLLLSLLLVTGMTNAANPLLATTPLRAFTTEQGLSQNTVSDITQDANGFIWVATDSGVNRMDGARISLIDDARNKLINRRINRFRFDSDGVLWAASIDGLLRISSNLDVINYHFPARAEDYEETNYLSDIAIGSDNQIIVISWRGVFYLNETADELVPSKLNAKLARSKIRLVKGLVWNGQLLLGTDSGLYLLDETNNRLTAITPKAFHSERRVRQIIKTSQNRFLIATDKGLYDTSLQAKKWQTKKLYSGDVSDLVVEGNTGYFSTADQIHKIDLATMTSQWLFALNEQLPRYSTYKISRLFMDDNHLLWIGTESQGLYLWSVRSQHFFTISQLSQGKISHLSNAINWSFLEDEDHNLWIGSDNGLNHVDFTNNKLSTWLTKKKGARGDGSESIYWIFKEKSELWLGTANGLILWDQKKKTAKKYRPEFLKQDEDFMVYYIAKLGDKLWLATSVGLVSFDHTNSRFLRESRVSSGKEASAIYFLRVKDDWLWLGDGHQLRRFNPETGVIEVLLNLPASNTNLDVAISDFYQQGSTLWIATSGYGLFEVDLKGTAKVVAIRERSSGFPDNILYRIIPDEDRLLLTSHSGLISFELKSKNAFVFDYYDGLTSNEFNEGAAYQLQSGMIILGTANGPVAFYPQSLKQTITKRAPRLLTIKNAENEFYQTSSSKRPRDFLIPADTSYLVFDFDMLDYMHPTRWNYRAKLTGNQLSQQFSENNGQLVLANLEPGNYNLSIVAIAADSALSSAPLSFNFTVKEKTWQSLPVITAEYLLLALLVSWLFYRRSRIKHAVIQLNKKLIEKDERLELALLDRHRGVWDWNLNNHSLDESIISIIHTADSVEEMTLQEYIRNVPEEHRLAAQELWHQFLLGEKLELFHTYPFLKQGSQRWIRATGRITDINEKGVPIRATGTWQDVTENKANEDRLSLLTQAFESTRDVILIIDQDLSIVEVNRTYDRLTGFKGNKLIGRNIADIAFNRISADAAEEIRQMIKVHGQWQGETTLPKRSGPSFSVEVRVDVLGELSANNYFVVTMSDSSGLSQQSPTTTSTAYYDNLTGYPNQALASDRLTHAIEQATINKSNVVLMTIELAQFDFHLQTIGKDAVGKLIMEMGKRILHFIAKDDTLARTGQDRFAVILESRENLVHSVFIIKNILDALKTPVIIEHVPVKIMASAGIASFPLDGTRANQLFARSVEALSLARKIGSHQFNYFSTETNKKALDKLAMKARLGTALENNEFFLVFQPKFEIRSGKQIGFEVFLRWRLEDGNIVYPSQFLSLAEDLNLVMPITEWLINHAFRTLRRWKDEKLPTVFAINLFPSQSVDTGLVQYLLDKLNEYELDPSMLHIEINETAIAQSISNGTQFIKELALTGFRVTLDEFGKGRISLTEVSQLPLCAVKVSREYVRDIGELPASDAMLRSIAKLADEQGWVASAKGIETDNQLDFLLSANYTVGQGYYFSDPLEESSARNFIIKHGI